MLYRGVFVDRIEVSHLWGIEGSLHVNPEHFKPRLNREGFVGEDLRNKVEPFLLSIHPKALEKSVECVREVLSGEQTKDWTILKWVTLWLSVPRSGAYTEADRLWDEEFRNRKAFRLLLPDDKIREVSIADLLDKHDEIIYLAPVNPPNTLIRHAIRVLRAKGVTVVQGVSREGNYLSYASIVGQSTGDLLISHFRDLMPDLLRIDDIAEKIVSEEALDEIFDEPPKLRIVPLGSDASALVAVRGDIWVNIEADAGKRIIEEICERNEGYIGLWIATMKHAPNQAAEIASVMKDKQFDPAPLGLVRRQYLRGLIK